MLTNSELLTALNIKESVVELSSGKFSFLSNNYTAENLSHGYPPALVPFLNSDSGVFLGMWKHFFVDRAETYVSVYKEIGVAYEDGRVGEHILINLIIAYIERRGIDIRVQNLINEHFKGSEQLFIDAVRRYGESPSVLNLFVNDKSKLPLEALDNSELYGGNHPISSKDTGYNLVYSRSNLVCGYEYDHDFSDPAIEAEMPWLSQEANLQELFVHYYDNDDMARAWMTLNSPGWLYSDAKNALFMLADSADDIVLSRISETWASENSTLEGDYVY